MAFGDWYTELAAKVNNWGRWGPDDQIGTANLITPDAVQRGVACVRTGKRFSLALRLSESEGIQMGAIPGRVNPLHAMTQLHMPITPDPDGPFVNDDMVVLALQCATHWDGLAHVTYDGRIYNGFPASVVTSSGASRCGIQNIGSLVSRGVLLDVARAKGANQLDPGYAIAADDLGLAEELARLTVQSGDIVLVRTGQMRHLRTTRPDKLAYSYPSPGLSVDTVEWFRARDVAAVATDNLTFEVWPCVPEGAMLPVHVLHLVEMGLTQGQNFVLEDLASDCADDGSYGFLLDASPQPITGAVGSPVNPIAVK